ncbi:hypothetical protein B0H65DRAFT_442908 [Neurospora tetraspora]|uniref:Uncharacterized protein n=1 Tax=Neurospora tetraspora TaxID=94610 RepID=A0AAE0MS23_9PEZI|nr:hypothetical protein B0H65DRAFT_442908 [Neurospora tetraspora]
MNKCKRFYKQKGGKWMLEWKRNKEDQGDVKNFCKLCTCKLPTEDQLDPKGMYRLLCTFCKVPKEENGHYKDEKDESKEEGPDFNWAHDMEYLEKLTSKEAGVSRKSWLVWRTLGFCFAVCEGDLVENLVEISLAACFPFIQVQFWFKVIAISHVLTLLTPNHTSRTLLFQSIYFQIISASESTAPLQIVENTNTTHYTIRTNCQFYARNITFPRMRFSIPWGPYPSLLFFGFIATTTALVTRDHPFNPNSNSIGDGRFSEHCNSFDFNPTTCVLTAHCVPKSDTKDTSNMSDGRRKTSLNLNKCLWYHKDERDGYVWQVDWNEKDEDRQG